MKFGDLEVWKRSSRLCADLYEHFQDVMGMLLKGVKTISTFLNDIQCLNQKKALKHYAKAYFSNDIRQ